MGLLGFPEKEIDKNNYEETHMSVNIGKLAATTIDARKDKVSDNVTAHNGLLTFIKKSGNIETFDGGEYILEAISYAENTNAGSYSGADQFAVDAQDNIDAAKYGWAQYAVTLPITGRQELTNNGKAQIINLVKNEVLVAETSMANLINRHLFLDGTGNSGKNLTGLAAAVPLAPTNIYGSINRNTAGGAFWKNKKFQATVDGGDSAIATPATIGKYFNTFYRQLVRGTDKPNVIIAGDSVYGIYEASLQTIQRVTSSETASLGFTALEYKGIPVILETTASGITNTSAYFLNTKYLKWRPHVDRNFVSLDDKDPFNQDLTVKALAFAGNLTCSGSMFQGIYSNT